MPLSSQAAIECDHCGLPVPDGLVEPHADTQFCCRGCAAAYSLIHAHGLQRYYTMAQTGTARAASGDRSLRYAELDRDAFVERHTTEGPNGQRTATLGLEGIHCAACIWLLERLPRVAPGVIEARVDWRRATITVRWSTKQTSLSAIAEAIDGLGYRPHPLRRDTTAQRHRAEDRRRLVAIGVAFAAAGNNMLIAGSLYLGLFTYMDAGVTQLLRIASCAVGLVSLAWPGREFFRGAWAALRSKTPHMDLPVALALLVGGVAGVVNTVRGHGELYFDTLSVLVLLLLVGRFIQVRQQRHAAAALEVLYRMTPRVAHKLVEGGFADVPADVLEPGDVVRVCAEEVIPGDGTVVGGQSSVDAQVLTGESMPVAVREGDTVAAGTVVRGTRLQIRIDAVGEDTRMGRVLALVERSSQARPAIVAAANRIGGWFVLTVLGLSLATLVTWLAVDAGVAVDHAVALLIVACPCALALATPLAVAVALGRAARRGILIKGGDVLQRLATPGTIWLDKTGTLTEGRVRVVQWHGDDRTAAMVAALQRHSAHPIARAFVQWVQWGQSAQRASSERPCDEVTDVVQQSGGIQGVVSGRRVVVGNAAFVQQHCAAAVAGELRRATDRLLAATQSPVFVAVEGHIVAVAGIGDPLRPDARRALDELRRRGWTLGILSGDHPAIVTALGRTLGIPASRALGGLLPEDKVTHVRAGGAASAALQRGQTASSRAPVVMVGDGINDSAALAAASVGVAVHGGAEASLQAAPVYLGRPGLGGLLDLLDASHRTMRAIRRNFAISLAYNAVAVGLAMAGLVSPLVAAVLMPLSSISVVALSLSLRLGPMRQADESRSPEAQGDADFDRAAPLPSSTSIVPAGVSP